MASPTKKRVNSPQAKKRRREQQLKLLGLLVALVLLGYLGYAGVQALRAQDASLQLTPPSDPIERIVFNTNGVLPDDWISSVLKLRSGMTMMEADIHELKAKIEAYGQVRHASVERVFPSDLRITVEEHTPVLRLAFENKEGKRHAKIVSRDGSIYEGVGYLNSGLQELPFVQPYVHLDGSYEPMRGIEEVARLLELAKRTEPKIFRTWDVVWLRHYSGDLDLPGQVIEIRSAIVPRILFSASIDFERQLERLAYILKHVKAHGNPSMEVIDLSLAEAASVQFTSETAIGLFNNSF
ncbi:MAG: FtsQ-type POTRA domain-containing protein [Verrucomicrobiota bacterium]